MKKSSRFGKKINFLFVVLDAIIIFGFSVTSFAAFYSDKAFLANLNATLIYSGSVSALTLLLFAILGVYKILPRDIGLLEVFKIFLITAACQIAGIIAINFIKYMPNANEFFWIWCLMAISVSFTIPNLRAFARTSSLIVNIVGKRNKVRTLVIGAGASGKVVVDESRRNNENHNRVVVFVDDDVNKIGGTFANIPVKGPISNLPTIIKYHQIEEVIIAISDISQERLHEILSILDGCPVRIRRLPTIAEMQGPNDTRIIDVDLNDLLERKPIVLDNHEVYSMLNGKVVMVTGAGGSIGSELVRQIFKTKPKTLILFDIYENSTYDIQMELMKKIRDEYIRNVEVVALIGSTYNEVRVEQIIKKYRPDYIYHAAAYKHVPLMEDSPAEAIRTNVIGTYNVAKLANKYRVKKMVLVSTDKAVRPTNVMGATKRFAETIIQYFSTKSKTTAYAAVRFGNVLGSNGSVVPLFKKQIEAGGPLTITDKRITRYFMTIPEAVSLILQCGLFAEGGEIFILDMGKPVKILSLAEKLIRQAGLVPNVDIKIVEVGLRPGEKLYEELLIDLEHQQKTANKKIFVESTAIINKALENDIVTISKVFNMESTTDVKVLLSKLIDTYRITENKPKAKPANK